MTDASTPPAPLLPPPPAPPHDPAAAARAALDRSLIVLAEEASAPQIIAVLDTVAHEPRLALDLEADSFHRYVERVCLVQLGTATTDILFDPVTHGLPDPLRALLGSPEHTWVLHGGDYDILSLERDFQLRLGRLFDTQIAARILGRSGLGLQALLEAELGVKIGKGEQRSDWRQRPLSADQVRYARQDIAHLLPLADRLTEQLRACGRLAWAEQECELLRLRPAPPKTIDPDAWIKLKGVRELPDAARAVARAVHAWREGVAARQDRAAFRVLPPEMIVVIARESLKRGPPSADELRRWRGISQHVDTKALANVISMGLSAPDSGRAPLRRGPAPAAVPPSVRARIEALRKARVDWAAPLGLDPALLLPPGVIDALAALPSPSAEVVARVPGMTPWRYEVMGGSLLAVLESM